ncbi:hypothetical protein KR222_002703 [Zaprionus bogoriensis]|nr:hypothetical protein KR222_002703 [Zaprionus bogoriensis]
MSTGIESDSQREVEKLPLDSSFFEALWPLILDENECRVESENAEYFVPRQRFNQMRWHTMLSKVGFPGYETPHVLRCCEAARRQEQQSEEEALQAANTAAEQQGAAALADFEAKGSLAIRPVDKEAQHLLRQQERRQRLAYKFANRKYPWTMQTPSHELGFAITPELRAIFKCPLELEILEGIHHYNCKMMLIDAGSEVCADDLQRWIKFRPYVQLLVTVRCPRVERHLQLMQVFQTLLIEENQMNTWHQELEASLRAGLHEARAREIFKNCADAFVFVFSRYRGICTCDTYKILRRI